MKINNANVHGILYISVHFLRCCIRNKSIRSIFLQWTLQRMRQEFRHIIVQLRGISAYFKDIRVTRRVQRRDFGVNRLAHVVVAGRFVNEEHVQEEARILRQVLQILLAGVKLGDGVGSSVYQDHARDEQRLIRRRGRYPRVYRLEQLTEIASPPLLVRRVLRDVLQMIDHRLDVAGVVAEPGCAPRIQAHQRVLVHPGLYSGLRPDEVLHHAFYHVQRRERRACAELEGRALLFSHRIDNENNLLGQIDLGNIPHLDIIVYSGCGCSDGGGAGGVGGGAGSRSSGRRTRLFAIYGLARRAIITVLPRALFLLLLLLRVIVRGIYGRGGLQSLGYHLDLVVGFLVRHVYIL